MCESHRLLAVLPLCHLCLHLPERVDPNSRYVLYRAIAAVLLLCSTINNRPVAFLQYNLFYKLVVIVSPFPQL